MDDREFDVTWKGKKATLTLREEGDEIKGYVGGKKHALTVTIDDDDVDETFCHDDLEYDEDALSDLLVAGDKDEDDDKDEDEDDDKDEDDDEDEDDDDDKDEDDDEDRDDDSDEESSDDEDVDEDDDADWGEPVKNAKMAGVPTLHAVMVGYGKGIGVDGDIKLMRDLFRKLQDSKVLNVNERLLHGEEATAKNALDAVKMLEPGDDDVVWFAYSGHGAMSEGERYLCTRGKMLRRAAVSEAFAKVGARLAIVLSDCCANDVGRLTSEEKYGAARAPDVGPTLKKLFRDYRGAFDVTSSSDYQYSFGGVFTPVLIKKVLLSGKEDTWKGVISSTTKLVMAEGEGAMSKDGARTLKEHGQKVIDAQRPVAYKMPEEV